MGLNAKLAEVIALAHDLGHTPFGHKGEEIIDEIMKAKGYEGFDHNNQSYEICKKWGLSEEVLEGLKKHSSPHDPLTKRFITDGKKPLLEAQVVDLADEIAYTVHDFEDGLLSGILKFEDVQNLKLWKRVQELVPPEKDEVKYIQSCTSAVVRILTKDLKTESEKAIEANNIKSVEDVRNAEEKLIRHSAEILEELAEAREFLMDNFYKHPKVIKFLQMADAILEPLFEHYLKNPQDMNSKNKMKRINDGEDIVLVVKDFVVGMTDPFAIEQAIKHNIITQQKADEMSKM
jgi:dGTPase